MAGANNDCHKVDIPKNGDVIAIYANGLGIVAYGIATEKIIDLSDDRVGNHPTRLRKLSEFRFMAYPIKASDYKTSNTQTLQQVHEEKKEFLALLHERAMPLKDATLFK